MGNRKKPVRKEIMKEPKTERLTAIAVWAYTSEANGVGSYSDPVFDGPQVNKAAIVLAAKFHEAYERLAPKFDYITRGETRKFDQTSANGRLMIAVAEEILKEYKLI